MSTADAAVPSEAQQQAEALRLAGNESFKSAHYLAAIDKYTEAIELFPSVSLYLNRAMSCLKVGYSGEAISDADEALKLEPGNPKAYYRKGVALLQLGKLKEALVELRTLAKLVPDDADARERLSACEKEYKRVQFLKAIESADTVPPSRKFKPDAMPAPPPDYDGPRFPADGVLTAEYADAVAEVFRKEKLIPQRDACQIIIRAIAALSEQPNVVPVRFAADEQITVCGDTHGQYYDTLNIFRLAGKPGPTNRFLFNGDFVDRGSYSLENVILLLLYKATFPAHFFMSRGNHESLMLNRMYGFEGEVLHKYSDYVFDLLQEAFRALPLAHVLNDKVFVTHGGLFSSDEIMVADIQKIDRFRDIPDSGPMCEMLWSDPMVMPGRAKSKRGTGLDFGPDVTKKFLERHKFELVVRSHEVNPEGFVSLHDGKLVTIFSAPNYCDQVGNKGAFLRFRGASAEYELVKFEHVQHPGKKPMAYAPRGLMGF